MALLSDRTFRDSRTKLLLDERTSRDSFLDDDAQETTRAAPRSSGLWSGIALGTCLGFVLATALWSITSPARLLPRSTLLSTGREPSPLPPTHSPPPPSPQQISPQIPTRVGAATPPADLPDAVIDLLGHMFLGRKVVDLGARSDGIARRCAASARRMTAVVPQSECAAANQSVVPPPAHTMACASHFMHSCLDADVYTWWHPPVEPDAERSEDSARPLRFLERLIADGLLRSSVAAVLIFHNNASDDRRRWRQLRPHVNNFTTVRASAEDPRVFTVGVFNSLTWGMWSEPRPTLPKGACARVKPPQQHPPSDAAMPLKLPASIGDGSRRVDWHEANTWTGPADPHDRRCVTSCDMVIAHCDEPLDWLPDDAPRFRRIVVYTKCGKPIGAALRALPNVEFLVGANVGSVDFAIVQHIVRRHAELAPLTVFCAGDSPDHYMCSPDAVLPPRPRAELLRADDADAALFPGIQYKFIRPNKPASFFRTFKRKRSYVFATSNRTFVYRRAPYADLGAWLTDLVGQAAADELFSNRGVYVQFGGFFAARRHELQRYPRALFEAMAAHQVSPNEEVDHYMERVWGILLSAPRVPPTLAAHVAARAKLKRL